MVIYMDTSALINLYIEEAGREMVISAVASADRIATSTAAYAEARAGLARRRREGDLKDSEYQNALHDLGRDWRTYTRLPVQENMTLRAGQLAEAFALRGYDAIHLASALHLAERFDDLQFLAFGQRLVDAASGAGLTIYAD